MRGGRRERLSGEVGEHRAAPECECGSQVARRLLGVSALEGSPACAGEPLELRRVQIGGIDMDDVARPLAVDRAQAVRLVEESPQAGHVHLERVVDGGRRVIAPDVVDEPVARDDLVRVHQKDREQRSLLRSAERERCRAAHHLDGAENAVCEAHGRLSELDRSTMFSGF